MRIDTLEAYDIPPDLLALWRETVGPELLPVQARAVKEFGLFTGGNLIVFAPTSSGKTFIGEMAAVKAAREGRKVLYLVPQKALAEEKYQELRARYGRVGLQVVVSSRDHREHDAAIERHEFHLAVVVFEKMQALLVQQPQLVEAVGLVVVDELQLITDEERGPALELLLTRLRSGNVQPRILGLSAVLGEARALADWLGGRLLADDRRPVELRKGVLCRGTFSYREHNSGARASELFLDNPSGKRHELILGAAEELARRGEQVLVFLPDRGTTVSFARILAGRLGLPAADEALRELRRREETCAREALYEVLSSGVAFHNADLLPEERALVERHFRGGGVRVLFSTSTLAMGLNLPAKNVIIDARRWQFLPRYGRWSLEDIPKAEYENMSGRAGRLSHTRDFGRSILVTSSMFEADVLLEHYATPGFEEKAPALRSVPLETPVLGLVATGLARSRQELASLLLSSFTGAVHWRRLGAEALETALDRALGVCADSGLLRVEAGGQLAPTELGRVSAARGVDTGTAITLAQWVREARSVEITPLEVLAVVGLTPAGRQIHVGLGGNERYDGNYLGEALRRAGGAGITQRPIFARLTSQGGAVEYDGAKALKKALLLADWIDELDTRELEERYQVWAGAVRRIGGEYAWLVEVLALLARASGWPEARWRALEELADRLVHGVRPDALPLAKLRVAGLGRGVLRNLVDNGLTDAATVRAADPESIRPLVGNEAAFASLRDRLEGGSRADALPRSLAMPEGLRHAAEPEALYVESSLPLVVDLQAGRVTYRGHEVPTRPPNHLQRLPMLVLAVLTRRPGEVISMSELADELVRIGGLRKRPSTSHGRNLRYRLVRPLRKALAGKVPPDELERLIEWIPGKGLRLNPTGQVRELLPPLPPRQPPRPSGTYRAGSSPGQRANGRARAAGE